MSDDHPYAAGIAFCEGRFVPIEEARIPLLDWGFLRSDAVQDTVSVFDGAFFRLEDHLTRFERNWKKLRMQCPHDRDTVRAILTEAVRRTRLREAYVQMVMTRGRAPIGSRASAMEIGTPAFSYTLMKTTAGAMQPKSMVVPAQSRMTALILPR